MCESVAYALPSGRNADGLAALPSGREFAAYDAAAQVVSVFASSGGALVETEALGAGKAPARGRRLAFLSWRMAANAPVVAALDDDGALWVVRAGAAPVRLHPGLHATRLVGVGRMGAVAVLQVREEMVFASLQAPEVHRVRAEAADVWTTAGGAAWRVHAAPAPESRLVVKGPGVEADARLVPPAGAGAPYEVVFGPGGPSDAPKSVYVLYGARSAYDEAVGRRVTLQTWAIAGEGASLVATKAVHFHEPFVSFAVVPATGQLACEWPARGGYVMQGTEEAGAVTSRVRPAGTDALTVWCPTAPAGLVHVTKKKDERINAVRDRGASANQKS